MATSSTSSKTSSRLPLLKQPGDIGYDKVASTDVTNDPFAITDTTFNYDKISADQVSAGNVTAGQLSDRFLTAADYNLVDPSQIASQYGDINREQTSKNSALSSQLALDALDTELQGLQNYAPAAAALKRGELAKDNQFNQGQRDASLLAGDPTIRSDLMSQAARARSFAAGGVPDSIGDKALELGIRSRAADSAAGGGFGVNSGAARKASSLMSAEQRIALSQYGDQLLTSNIGNRNSTLIAPTAYSDAGAQISVNPTQSASALASQTASQLNSGNITSDKALSSLTQQEQFKSGLQQDTNVKNFDAANEKDLNQVKLNLQADTSNVDRQFDASKSNQSANLNAASQNASNAIDTQKAAMGIKSQESQFTSQLAFNTKNANADRSFQAANINAGRALEVATSNRSIKLQVDQANSTMTFQDQQARKAEAAANARSAASNATSRANASLSYSAQKDAIAANATAAERNFQFQLEQQKRAGQQYEDGVKRSQNAQDNATLGNLAGIGLSYWNGGSTTKNSDGTTSSSSGSGIRDTISGAWDTVSGWFGY